MTFAGSLRSSLALAALAVAGCGDDDEFVDRTDAAVSIDAPPAIDAAIDAPAFVFTPPTPIAVPLSPAGSDLLLSAIPGPGGSFYAAGPVGLAIGATRFVNVIKLEHTGQLDTAWGGGDGVVVTPLDYRGGTTELRIVTQPGGKLVVIAQVPNAVNANDRDLALLRLNADGTVDNSFGGNNNGIKVLDLSTAANVGGTLTGLDAPRGLAVDGTSGVLYVFGMARAADPRTDTDWTVTKLSVDGAVDMSFAGGTGRYTIDLQNVSETGRNLDLTPDGHLLLEGYANTPGLGSPQPLLVKITTAGVVIPTFGNQGIYHDTVLALQTEVYSMAIQGTTGFAVSAGYGRQSGTNNDWISLRFNVATGARDLTWGGAANGAVVIDPSGMDLSDNCRGSRSLPEDRTLLFGSVGPGNLPTQDAAWAILDSTGGKDTTFGTGVHLHKLNADADGNDAFWGAAVNGSKVLVVGFRGGGALASQTAANNDDSYVIAIDLPRS